MEDVVLIVKDLGFPIFVALFLLLRVDKVLRCISKKFDKMIFILQTKGCCDEETDKGAHPTCQGSGDKDKEPVG